MLTATDWNLSSSSSGVSEFQPQFALLLCALASLAEAHQVFPPQCCSCSNSISFSFRASIEASPDKT